MKMGDKLELKHFSESEVEGLDPVFSYRLDTAREKAGVPFIITSPSGSRPASGPTSGFRTPDENDAIASSVKDSAHLTGKAVDLRVIDGLHRFYIVKGLIEAGFNRIGIYTKHIHADVDEGKPQDVVWIGVS